MEALSSLFALVVFIYLMYHTMKYVFSIIFGVTKSANTSNNIFQYFALAPLRTIFSMPQKGMMGYFEANRFLSGLHKGLVLDGQDKRLFEKDSFNHMGIIARTGGGKTSCYIITNILKLARDNSSMILTDLSGELYEKTSGYLQRQGYKVQVLDPEKLQDSIGYNPLYYALSSIEIDEIAEILIKSANPGQIKSEDKMWLDGAKSLLTILIKVLVATHDHRYINLANLRYLINNFGESGTALDELIFKYADEKTFNEWKGFVSGNLKTVQSFVSTANVALNTIGINDNLAYLTVNHHINFQSFREQKSVLYIRIPAQKQQQYSFLLNLFYKQFFNAMMEKLPSRGDLPVYCLLDEFGNMNIPGFSSTITTIRKYKVSISIVLQDYNQLEHQYGKNEALTILNGGVTGKLFFSGADFQTTNMLSQMIGEHYVNKLDEYGKVHHIKEPILSNAEIRTMKDNEVLLIYGNRLPLKMKVKPYYKDFMLNSYTKFSPMKSEKHLIDTHIDYIDLNVGLDND
ncbi:MAG: hypothetical protein CJD30_11225 [Sulfuricurvum sp. PD_MW2]|jgi:type IV secretory pathway TraG/TraD family ATPase VirD4|uniref:type IV secretory system conjugative DNA transfer family protein n=1 Tax=Sulfuricurvum sp. PD_MW2 TaxID=2027917 RepID=UPI000C0628DA|nr:type IV secretory system conjugative DNA transfer family protein [Sulfuricurvum sp. PD_MW2]PHM16509.1 MAG: hypothetical protein CJD30_11225 [Sulfuricurvum sp. PD_MW2]